MINKSGIKTTEHWGKYVIQGTIIGLSILKNINPLWTSIIIGSMEIVYGGFRTILKSTQKEKGRK